MILELVNGIWRIHSGGTGSSGTGPSGAHSGSKNFILSLVLVV